MVTTLDIKTFTAPWVRHSASEKMYLIFTIVAALLLGVVHTSPPSAIIFSAGFTNSTVLQSSPSSSSLYGFSYPSSSSIPPSITVTVQAADGTVVASVPATTADAGSGTDCDGQCYSAGYLSGVGTSSCCQAPTCPMGCAIGGVVSTKDECLAQCGLAKGCDYTIPNTTLDLSMCDGCLTSCPGKGECEAGCGFRFSDNPAPVAWKVVLPPQPASNDLYTVSVTCSNCAPGAAPTATLHSVSFGIVYYCSGQSNGALGMLYTYSYKDVVDEINAGGLDDIRLFQFGGMGLQNAAQTPVYATTSLTYPTWQWQDLPTALAQKDYLSFGNFPATCFYFAYSVKKMGGKGPFGLIANAVGGTTLAAWSDASVLDSCPNSTDTASAAPPMVLFNGMVAPLFNTTISAWVWCKYLLL